ncbi:hypothetical protein IT575_02575 [bacterium]|nr:hypothetical protein [bacterium]
MQLALFTPAGYVWPVLRNFEVFIAKLGAQPSLSEHSLGARTLGELAAAERHERSPLYPADAGSELGQYQVEPRTGKRLELLHRDLYEALLRPSAFFTDSDKNMAETFWPDLRDTHIERKLEAFFFFYLRRTMRHVSVLEGLSVLRATFFNHEAVEPEHWLFTTQERLASLAAQDQLLESSFDAPLSSRIDDLAFVLNTDQDRAPNSPGWITGTMKRASDGRVNIHTRCGIDDWLADNRGELEAARPYIEAEIFASLSYVFGWEMAAVEAA